MTEPALYPGLRERNKQRRIDAILTAALQLLREEPEQVLTVERIATRAGVAPMTVFNLIGTREQLFRAMADSALADLDLDAIRGCDAHDRARRIVRQVVHVLHGDADVFRVLLSQWSYVGGSLEHDPTAVIIGCFREGVASGSFAPGLDVQKYGEVISSGLVGAINQWTSGVLSDRRFLARALDVVDVAFAAAAADPGDRRSVP